MNKKTLAILLEVVQQTPYTDHKTACLESVLDVIAKYDKTWTKRKEANFRRKAMGY